MVTSRDDLPAGVYEASVAVHEAAHATVALSLGYETSRMSMESSGLSSSGWVHTHHPEPRDYPREAVVMVAGALAQARWLEEQRYGHPLLGAEVIRHNGAGDAANVQRLIDQGHIRAGDRDRARAEAERILSDPTVWSAVIRVSKALRKRLDLDGGEFRRLAGQVPSYRPPAAPTNRPARAAVPAARTSSRPGSGSRNPVAVTNTGGSSTMSDVDTIRAILASVNTRAQTEIAGALNQVVLVTGEIHGQLRQTAASSSQASVQDAMTGYAHFGARVNELQTMLLNLVTQVETYAAHI
jgi:hypothetical protein